MSRLPRFLSRSHGAASSLPAPQTATKTKAELELLALLAPFQLAELEDSVQKLAAAGNLASTLRGLDDSMLAEIEIEIADRQRIKLAGWLHSVAMAEYGGGIARCGVCSLEALANGASDLLLKSAGVSTMGARRRLQRHVRTELPHLIRHLKSSGGVLGLAGGVKREERAETPAAEPRSDKLHKLASHEAYDEQWRLASAACLLGGAAPGYTADLYVARTPQEGGEWRVVRADGSAGPQLRCR